MNFYIKKLRLWFKSHNQSYSYTFKKNKVNVITGDSSTGKSSILQIIDYCLLASDTSIVEDVINHNVSWYGLSFHLNGRDYVIARKAPSETGIIDNTFYWQEDSEILPEGIPVPTIGVTRASLLEKFNREFQCDNLFISNGSNRKAKKELSFRSFLMMNYLTEEIIATNHSFLDSKFFGDEDYEMWEMEIFKLAIGMQEIDEERLEMNLQQCKKSVSSQETAKEQDARAKERYEKELQSILKRAKSLNLWNNNEIPNQDELLQLIKSEIKAFKRFVARKENARKIEALEQRKRDLDKRIKEYKLLRTQYNRAKKYADQVKDSLSPVEYLMGNLDKIAMSNDTVELLNSLNAAYQCAVRVDIPDDYLPSEMEGQLQSLQEEKQKVENELDSMKVDVERSYNVSWLYDIVQLEKSLKDLKPLKAKFLGDENLINLKDERDLAEKKLKELKLMNGSRKDDLLKVVQTYYDIQDGMSDNYRNMEVCLHDQKVVLRLMKNGAFYPIKNVGSKSNFMFMHLCFFLGLHEYLQEINSKRVSNFLFIDQPSIPYFSTNKREENEKEVVVNNREDESRLHAAFRLINSFMKQNIREDDNRNFQIILIEHADPSLWADCEFFETRYIFTEDKDYGLIPKFIYEP